MADIKYIQLPSGTTYNIVDAGAVQTTNIVTSISASSTDSQVPSAKAMYTVIGDVESALQILLEGTS